MAFLEIASSSRTVRKHVTVAALSLNGRAFVILSLCWVALGV